MSKHRRGPFKGLVTMAKKLLASAFKAFVCPVQSERGEERMMVMSSP